MTEPILLTCTADAHRILRAVADELGISRETIDARAQFPDGYAAKLLSEPPYRGFSLTSLFLCAGALGKAIALVDDPRALRWALRQAKRRVSYDARRHGRNVRAQEMLRELLRRNGSRRWAGLTLEQIREHQRRAGKASGRARRRRKRPGAKTARPQRFSEESRDRTSGWITPHTNRSNRL